MGLLVLTFGGWFDSLNYWFEYCKNQCPNTRHL
jgi:hypothetical protein